MVKSFVSRLFHQFMAGRLRAEMPGGNEKLIETIVQLNATSQPASERRRPFRKPFQNPFRLGERAHAWRLEVPRVGVL